jgi:hypothetical protein
VARRKFYKLKPGDAFRDPISGEPCIKTGPAEYIDEAGRCWKEAFLGNRFVKTLDSPERFSDLAEANILMLLPRLLFTDQCDSIIRALELRKEELDRRG